MASAAEHFGRVLAEAAEAAEAAAPASPARWRTAADALADSPAATALAVASASVAMLLMLRPPFVVRFERDAQRPWRGASSLCWLSVLTTASMMVLVVTLAPLLPSRHV